MSSPTEPDVAAVLRAQARALAHPRGRPGPRDGRRHRGRGVRRRPAVGVGQQAGHGARDAARRRRRPDLARRPGGAARVDPRARARPRVRARDGGGRGGSRARHPAGLLERRVRPARRAWGHSAPVAPPPRGCTTGCSRRSA
nr:hypothetical protein [Angustibacter aerolatus]